MKWENNIKQGMCHFFFGGNLQLNNEQAIFKVTSKSWSFLLRCAVQELTNSLTTSIRPKPFCKKEAMKHLNAITNISTHIYMHVYKHVFMLVYNLFYILLYSIIFIPYCIIIFQIEDTRLQYKFKIC